MLCGNRDIGFKVKSACNECNLYQEGKIYKLSQLIPKGHCLELLHSLLPYLTTFKHGGWFSWERSKNKVVVCCPSVECNVCAELKKISEPQEIRFEYKVLKVQGGCGFYAPKQVLEIRKKDFDMLCWGLFNNTFPYLKTELRGISITCGMSKGKSQFELLEV